MFIGKILSGVKPTHDINAAVGIPGRGDKAEAILMESIERANKDWPTRTGQQGPNETRQPGKRPGNTPGNPPRRVQWTQTLA